MSDRGPQRRWLMKGVDEDDAVESESDRSTAVTVAPPPDRSNVPEGTIRCTVRIKRFDPDADGRAQWATFTVDALPDDRVLDVLHSIKWYQDGSLTFRRSCAHGVCGSDAMVINGVNRLACKVLVADTGSRITVEPIRGLPVVKDLIVDMGPFFESYKRMLPFLINDEPTTDRERLQTADDRERIEEGTKCILCAACTTSARARQDGTRR